jgi:hypothetical protein
MKTYSVTKFFIENNIVMNYPTETLHSSNEVFELAQHFFNNGKIYSTHEEGSNVSYLKCVGDDTKIISVSESNLP